MRHPENIIHTLKEDDFLGKSFSEGKSIPEESGKSSVSIEGGKRIPEEIGKSPVPVEEGIEIPEEIGKSPVSIEGRKRIPEEIGRPPAPIEEGIEIPEEIGRSPVPIEGGKRIPEEIERSPKPIEEGKGMPDDIIDELTRISGDKKTEYNLNRNLDYNSMHGDLEEQEGAKHVEEQKEEKADYNESSEVDEPQEKEGGSYRDVKRTSDGETHEVHHMPADSASKLERDDGPAIRMEKEDHRQTASCGRSKEAAEYRERQKELIDQGKFREALQMDIDDIHEKFGDKYDDAIAEMLDYVDQLEQEGKI